MNKLMYAITFLTLVLCSFNPYDPMTWWLEIFWVIGGLAIIPIVHKSKGISDLLCILLFVHAIILIYGGYYTYERTPLGQWWQELFDFTRNHYDRLGHFAQGFIPAILAREILLRCQVINKKSWLGIIVFVFCLAFSAFFEILEFAAAHAFGTGAAHYLGSQGDIWDAQWDMVFCMIGAFTSLLIFSKLHNKQLYDNYGCSSEIL